MKDPIDPQIVAEAASKAMWEKDEVAKALGMELLEIGPGIARISMPVDEQMTNGHHTSHGGYIFLLADSTFAFACNSHNQNAVAQHCSITYIAPGKAGDILTATAQERDRSGRSGIYDVTVHNQDGVKIAEFRGNSRTIKGVHVETMPVTEKS